jgi:predicted lipoprotein with Yx(FWY)xxD motif
MRGLLGTAGLVVVLTLVGVSCSSDDDSATTTTGADDSTSTTAAAGADAVVIATGDTDLGEVLTDAEGATLYILTTDGTGAATCVDACAEIWPPVIAENVETHGELDIDVDLVDGDGARQVTINGRPVYTYSNDVESGDTTGQGFGGVWWVLDVDGNPIESTDAATTTLAE